MNDMTPGKLIFNPREEEETKRADAKFAAMREISAQVSKLEYAQRIPVLKALLALYGGA